MLGWADALRWTKPCLESQRCIRNVNLMNVTLATEISRLTPVEKLRLVEELWDTLAADPDQLPIPEWHQQALAEAQAAYESNPEAGSPWPEVKVRITRKT